MNISDINGARAKPLYTGLAKDIINNRDIKGSFLNYEQVINFLQNFPIYQFHFIEKIKRVQSARLFRRIQKIKYSVTKSTDELLSEIIRYDRIKIIDLA